MGNSRIHCRAFAIGGKRFRTRINHVGNPEETICLRAIFELVKQQGEEPVKTSTISEAQAIPLRFLVVITGQIYVGDIFRALDREDKIDVCIACASKGNCPFLGACVFMELWDQAKRVIDAVYDRTTIQTLINQE